MYRPRDRAAAAAAASDDEEIGSDYSSDGERNTFRTRERMPLGDSIAADSAVAAMTPQHLTSDLFSRPQKVWLDIDITATPEDLATGNASTTWKLLPHLPGKYLKQNMAVKDRHLVGDEHLAGDLRQCIPMEFEIVEHSNTFPFPMAIEAPGMMNKTLHRHGACLWRVQPDTTPCMVGRKAFEPTGIIDQHMIKNYSLCTLESLDSDISVVPASKNGQKKGYGRISTNTVAYETLINNLERGLWDGEFTETELSNIYDAPARHLRSVDVPQKIAEQIRDTLRPIVKETIDRCVNLEDMNFEVTRADGNPSFNSPKGFVGELVHGDVDLKNELTQKKLMTVCTFHVKGEFTFVLLGDNK